MLVQRNVAFTKYHGVHDGVDVGSLVKSTIM